MITRDLSLAVHALQQDDLIGLPTETVYGLAGNAWSEHAVKKIFELKQRPFFNPLILHLPSYERLNSVARNIPEKAILLAQAFWPGPLTLVLEKLPEVPNLITAGKPSVAIRVPRHPMALELLRQLDFPLAAPSANPFGSISPTSAVHVDSYFHEQLDVILDGGPCERGMESTIIGFQQEQAVLFRHGSIPLEDIEQIVGPVKLYTSNEQHPEAPGMLSRHYAPGTPTLLCRNPAEAILSFPDKKIGLLLFQHAVSTKLPCLQEVLSPAGSLSEAGSNLYSALHRLDRAGLDLILAEEFPEHGLGKTINDRLRRATAT